MTARDGYRYLIQILRSDTTTAGQHPARVDWGPAQEWARWSALREGLSPPEAFLADVRVAPAWSDRVGAPYLVGVDVSTMALPAVTSRLPIEYFADAAGVIATAMVGEGRLEDGEVYRYLPMAYADPAPPRPSGRSNARAPRIPVEDGSLAAFGEGALLEGEHDLADAPVVMPAHVLAETAALTLEHPGVETGGVLIGHLRRDPPSLQIYLEVTAQVPARHTDASATKLTFTPETWTAVRAAIALRGQGEIQLGSWHSHPVKVMCQCPEEKRRDGCPLGRGFFSADDRVLHRTVFGRAFNVALVVSDVHHGPPTFAMFGWRRGMIERRGFHRAGALHHAAL